MRRRTWAAAATVLVTAVASVLGEAVLTPTWAAGTTTWRPGEAAPVGTGFWSNPCGSTATTAHGPAGLSEDSADVAGTRSFQRASDGDVAWRYSPGSSQGGIAMTVPDPAHTTALSVRARSTSTNGVQERLLFYYRAPGADADTWYVGSATAPVGPRITTTDLTDRLVWLQHHGASLFEPAGWSAVFPSQPIGPSTNQPRSLHQFTQSKNYRGGPMLAAYELGCTGDGFAIDHLVLTDGSGTTDLDLAGQRTTTVAHSDHLTVLAGGVATLTGAVTGTATGPVLDGTLVLERASRSGVFSEVRRVAASDPVFTVRPDRTTRYRLRYLRTAGSDGSASAPVTVAVKSLVTLHAASDRVRLGSRVRLTGGVTPGVTGIPVTLQRQSGGTWQDLSRTTTDSDGTFRFAPRAAVGGPVVYRAVAGPHAGRLGATSPQVSVLVMVPTKVSARLSATTLRTGRTLHVTGRTTANLAGMRATLQRRVDGHWKALARATTAAKGAYAFSVTAGTPGTWTLRVRVARRDPYLAGVSARHTLTITPKPQPKPEPTPQPSPTPAPAPSPEPSSGGGTGIG